MSSGYSQFTNEDVEKSDGAPTLAPPEYPADQPLQYPTQQYPTQQQPLQYTVQQPGYAYQPQMTQVPGQQMIMHAAPGPVPKDYFGFALFVTICCCLPFGIVGLVKSSEVKNRAAMGDYNGATTSSAEAKRWSWAGCIVGGVIWGIAVIITCVYIGLIVAACNAGNCG